MVIYRYLFLIIFTFVFSLSSCLMKCKFLRRKKTPFSSVELNDGCANHEWSSCCWREANINLKMENQIWPFVQGPSVGFLLENESDFPRQKPPGAALSTFWLPRRILPFIAVTPFPVSGISPPCVYCIINITVHSKKKNLTALTHKIWEYRLNTGR